MRRCRDSGDAPDHYRDRPEQRTNERSGPVSAGPARQAQLAQWKKAIEDIFRRRLALRKQLLKHRINKRAYAADITRIDTTLCPESFRLAWIHYVIAWQRLSTDPSGLVPLVEIVVAAHTGNVVGAAHAVGGLTKDESRKSV